MSFNSLDSSWDSERNVDNPRIDISILGQKDKYRNEQTRTAFFWLTERINKLCKIRKEMRSERLVSQRVAMIKKFIHRRKLDRENAREN